MKSTVAEIQRGRICVRSRLAYPGRYKVGIIVREASKYSGETAVGVWYGENCGVSQASVDRMRQVYLNSQGKGYRVSWDHW